MSPGSSSDPLARRFPPGFLFGAATAAYQIEGAVDEDGRGESIWDTFCRMPSAIEDGTSGETACDHYHRYIEDVALMAELGLRAYRFSVAWPRVIPGGEGDVNAAGLDFYDRLVDALLAHGIRPLATLYHWDLPQALQDRGGWDSPESPDWFAAYAAIVADRLGDRVYDWITVNEPQVASFIGHHEGRHAPGARDFDLALRVAHNLLEAHARGAQAVRTTRPDARIGIALNLIPCHPADDSEEARAAADEIDRLQNRLFLEDVFARTGDQRLDFLGVNYYFRHVVAPDGELLHVPGERTAMGWEVYPEGLTEILTRVHRDYGPLPILVTENGAATDEGPDDPFRRSYLERHLAAAADAIEAGVPLEGYLVWSLLDNFEWDRGLSKRFGIVEVDYETQQRTVRASARWYADLIRA